MTKGVKSVLLKLLFLAFMKSFSKRKIAIIVFVAYIIILIKIILFKGSFFFRVVPTSEGYQSATSQEEYTGYNLLPFRTIKLFLSSKFGKRQVFFNLIGNVLLFLPFGFLLPVASKTVIRFIHLLLAAVTLSLLFELFQLFTHTGQFDVDDIMLNTAGAIVGYGLMKLTIEEPRIHKS